MSTQMAQRFKPLVHTAMSEVGVTSAYQRLTAGLSVLELGESLDLDQKVWEWTARTTRARRKQEIKHGNFDPCV